MKKLIILYLLLLLSIPLFAQLEVKEGSFKEVPGFVNINPDDNYQTDDNNLPFAVIKVRTENINDKQRRELKFSGNAGTFIMLEYKDGEVWVYLTAQYADYLKISHPDFSSIEFTLPYDLKPKCGYEMTLVNKSIAIKDGWGSLTITTTPENNASITLNGRVLQQNTPYSNDMMPSGNYEIIVSKERFKTTTKTIEIQNGENKIINIEMPYIYGDLIIDSKPSGATVFIDDNNYGVTPLCLYQTIVVGHHNLQLKKDGFKLISNSFDLIENQTLSFNETLEKGKNITFYGYGVNIAVYSDDIYMGLLPLDKKKSAELNIPQNYDIGDDFSVFMDNAEKGDASAQSNLGTCYWLGKGTEKDDKQAHYWFEKSAKNGNIIGLVNYADNFFYGQGVEPDSNQCYLLAMKAVETSDNAAAQYLVGNCYLYGVGVLQDDEEAIKWYKKAANQGDAFAQCSLGDYYYEKQDFNEMTSWYRKSADQGYTTAQANLGNCYYAGKGVNQNYTEAVNWFKKAANQGDLFSQYVLGICYLDGNGVKKDNQEAVKWFKIAADHGYARAQTRLGDCYIASIGVERDYAEAVKWFRIAADYGYAQAQLRLGDCYLVGTGVERDYAEAVKWYKEAADQGYSWAQYKLGNCYYYGQGVNQNFNEAKSWYQKAADQGNEKAKEQLKNM